MPTCTPETTRARSVSRASTIFAREVAYLDELANARDADGDKRELGGGEEGVDAHESENGEKLQGDHRDRF